MSDTTQKKLFDNATLIDVEGLKTYNNELRKNVTKIRYKDTANKLVEADIDPTKQGMDVIFNGGEPEHLEDKLIDLSGGVYYATTAKTATRVSNELIIHNGEETQMWNGSQKLEIDIPSGYNLITETEGEISMGITNECDDFVRSHVTVSDGQVNIVGESLMGTDSTTGGSIQLNMNGVSISAWNPDNNDEPFENELNINNNGLTFNGSQVITNQNKHENGILTADLNNNLNRQELSIGNFEIKNVTPYNYTLSAKYGAYDWGGEDILECKIGAKWDKNDPLLVTVNNMRDEYIETHAYKFIVDSAQVQYREADTGEWVDYPGLINTEILIPAGYLDESYSIDSFGIIPINFTDGVSESINRMDICYSDDVLYNIVFTQTAPYALRHTSKALLNGVEVATVDHIPSIDNKANIDGNYPDMVVGEAERANIANDLGGRPFVNEAEFTFRPSAGEDNSIKDDLATITNIKGNSLVWNQLLNDNNITTYPHNVTKNGNTYTIELTSTTAVPTIKFNLDSLLNEHKVLLTYNLSINSNTVFEDAFYAGYIASPTQWFPVLTSDQVNSLKSAPMPINSILTLNSDKGHIALGLYESVYQQTKVPFNAGDKIIIDNPRCIDLTLMFGAGDEPSTIEEFYARVPSGIDMNVYNPREIISVNAEEIVTVGFNVWDEQWENGYVNQNTGELEYGANTVRSKNFIPVIGGETYNFHCTRNDIALYFRVAMYDADKKFVGAIPSGVYPSTSTSNANYHNPWKFDSSVRYIKFDLAPSYGTTYNNDICINLSHSGYRNGEYTPYKKSVKDLSVIKKYFPNGLCSAGEAHDEIRFNESTQKWEAVQRIADVDMSTLDYVIRSADNSHPLGFIYANITDRKVGDKNVLSTKYSNNVTWTEDKSIFGNNKGNTLYIIDSDYNDVDTLKNDLEGQTLYYELAFPIITEIDETIDLSYYVEDFGTEEIISSVPSAPVRATIEYNFNANDTIRQNKLNIAKISDQLNDCKYDLIEEDTNNNTIILNGSVQEGIDTLASGYMSHAEGELTYAIGSHSHAEGFEAHSNGDYSHAEGVAAYAVGSGSHAGGFGSMANGNYSFAHGTNVTTSKDDEVAFGSYNISNSNTVFSIGDGNGYASHNILELCKKGESHSETVYTVPNKIEYVHNSITTSGCAVMEAKYIGKHIDGYSIYELTIVDDLTTIKSFKQANTNDSTGLQEFINIKLIPGMLLYVPNVKPEWETDINIHAWNNVTDANARCLYTSVQFNENTAIFISLDDVGFETAQTPNVVTISEKTVIIPSNPAALYIDGKRVLVEGDSTGGSGSSGASMDIASIDEIDALLTSFDFEIDFESNDPYDSVE